MNIIRYPVVAARNHEEYEFVSQGPVGSIRKFVHYQEIGHDLFNLAFGDWDWDLEKINDHVRSNNNDRDKVLGTVAFTVIDFMKYHPGASIFAKGNTVAKTRLYQFGISKHWELISQLFSVDGFVSGKWEPFQPGKNYLAFTLKRKMNIVNLKK